MYSKNRINVPHSKRMPVIKTKSIVDITGESSGWVHVEGVCVFASATAERMGEITAFEWWLWQRLMSAVGLHGSSNKDTAAPSGSFSLKCSLISS